MGTLRPACRFRVLVAGGDDELAALVKRIDEVDAVWRARDGREAMELALGLRPDLVVVAADVAGLDGLEATRRLHAADPTGHLVLVSDLDAHAAGAHEAGAIAFVKRSAGDDLPWIVRLLAAARESPADAA
jgi:DNA-binding NarL/FixJ family response regulator